MIGRALLSRRATVGAESATPATPQAASSAVLWTSAITPIAVLAIAGGIAYYIVKSEPDRRAGHTLF